MAVVVEARICSARVCTRQLQVPDWQWQYLLPYHNAHSDPCLEKMHISENVHAYTEDDDDFNIFSAQEGEWRLMN